jgi:hypothetical protein
MTTRRALLGAGALTLLAGCGPAEEPKVDVQGVVEAQQRANQRAASAYAGVAGTRTLRENAEERVRRLDEASVARFGAGPSVTSATSATGLEAALEAESAALRGAVAAIGELEDREWRALLAGVVADAAANESALLQLLDRPPLPTAFPGQPV